MLIQVRERCKKKHKKLTNVSFSLAATGNGEGSMLASAGAAGPRGHSPTWSQPQHPAYTPPVPPPIACYKQVLAGRFSNSKRDFIISGI